ncbi:hypothetical protein MuYL_4055 [Mucilaginibacter xinganensis]|uniref:Uncharacterized protein n=1 Tax=Mucilaginibacter xinganensis TaxID=1234841 RepID=A0A223P1P0_9SPHI|nr:hypothetical protein MuYL_4055 [Mucilaginibacter xinganensis]
MNNRQNKHIKTKKITVFCSSYHSFSSFAIILTRIAANRHLVFQSANLFFYNSKTAA